MPQEKNAAIMSKPIFILLLSSAAALPAFGPVTSISPKAWKAITSSADGSKIVAAVNREASAPYGGHVWTSTDSGTSFTKDTSVLEPKRWRAVANSADGKTVAAAEIGKPADETGQTFTGGAIYLSDDYGDTLRKTSAPMKYWHGIDVNSGGDFIAAVAKGGQIWRSTDAGKGWSASGPTRNWGSIAVSSTGDKLAAAEMGNYSDNRYAGGSIMLSTDSGLTWSDASIGAPKEGWWWQVTMSSDGARLAAIAMFGSLYMSADAGKSFVIDTSIGETYDWEALTMSSDGTAVAAAAWYGSIWYSSDSGARFVEDKSAPNKTFWSSISMDSTGTKLAACVQSDEGAADGSIWLSPPPPASSLEPTAKPAAAPPTPAQQLPVFGPVASTRGKSWKTITSSADGTTIVAAENREAVAPFGGNIWTSTDSGASFTEDTSVGEPKSWRFSAMSADGKKVAVAEVGNYAGYNQGYTGGGIFFSDDTGVTFRETSAPIGYWHGVAMTSAGDSIAAVMKEGRIWRSTDAAATWTASGPKRNWAAIAMTSSGDKRAAAEMGNFSDNGYAGGSIWLSTDSGVTWSESVGAPSEGWWWTLSMSSDGKHLAALAEFGNLWMSSDSGATFVVDTSIGETQDWQAISMSSDGTRVAAAVWYGSIYYSSNSGASFMKDTSAPNKTVWSAITMDLDGSKIAATVQDDQGSTDGYIWLSPPPPASSPTAKPVAPPTPALPVFGPVTSVSKAWSALSMSSDGMYLTAAVDQEITVPYGGPIFTSSDGGQTWTEDTTVGGVKRWIDVALSSDGWVVAAEIGDRTGDTFSGGGIYISEDFGATGFRKTSAPMAYWHAVAMSVSGGVMAGCVRNGSIWLSKDYGESWAASGPTKDWTSIACDSTCTNLVAVEGGVLQPDWTYSGGNVYHSTDSGSSWLADTSAGKRWWWTIALSSDGTHIAATERYGNLWISTDSGASYAMDKSVGGPQDWRAIAISADGTKIAANVWFGAIWYSSDAGASFDELPDAHAPNETSWSGLAMTSSGDKQAACVMGDPRDTRFPGLIYLSPPPPAGTASPTPSSSALTAKPVAPPTPAPTPSKKKSDGAVAVGPAVAAVVAALAIALVV